jgi:PAS domain S-box-containing protein
MVIGSDIDHLERAGMPSNSKPYCADENFSRLPPFNEILFHRMADTMTDAFWIYDPVAGQFIYANSACAVTWGQSRKRLLQRPESFYEAIHPQDRFRVTAEVRKAGVSELDLEYRIRQPDGGLRWVRDRRFPIHSDDRPEAYIAGVVCDITDRKRSQQALIESHVRFVTVLDSLDADIYVADMETHEILLMNQHMRDSYGGDLVGKKCWQSLRQYNGPCGFCTNEKLVDESGRPAAVCVWEYKNPRSGKWYINYDRAIKWVDGRLVRLQIATDISRVKELEKESLRIQAQLQQTQKMEAIGTLAGGIAHDFNNILSAVIGYTEIALTDIDGGSLIERNLQQVLKAGYRARDLVKQILTFSRQTDREFKPVHIETILHETFRLLRASLPSTISIQQDVRSKAAAMADPTQIHQVVMNLCTNAAHAMRETGGVLKLSLEDLVLDDTMGERQPGLATGPYMRLTVEDTGHGMDAKLLDRIFDPFFTTKNRGEGTGMGLAVVLGIVKSHGGMISVESEVGQGTIFKILLPAIMCEIDDGDDSQPNLPTGVESILFVDDEMALVDLGAQILKRLGYQVTTRTSSIEALELFIADPGRFDLVISDTTMPNLTGDMLAQKMLSVRPDIPVILCTGYSERMSHERALDMGIAAFVLKPIVMSELAGTVRQVLDESG